MWRLLMQLMLPMLMNGSGNPGQGPFGTPFGGQTPPGADQGPINVEAEVIGEDGESQAQKARRQWDARSTGASAALQGRTLLVHKHGYALCMGIIAAVAFFAGIAVRVYHLISGNVFSLTIVPVVIGILSSIVVGLICLALMSTKRFKGKMPFVPIDLTLTIGCSTLMGWAWIVPFALTAIIGGMYRHFKKDSMLPAGIVFLILCGVWFLILGFPGLASAPVSVR